jgi:2-haloacid dehalogenase
VNAASVVVFDVNGTLSDMSEMRERFREVGAPAEMAEVWFAALLRDGFALAAAGSSERFATIGAGVLACLLTSDMLDRPLEHATRHILEGFLALEVHPDVPDGVRALAAGGARLVTLTNGTAEVGEQLLARAGVRDMFERLLSVEEAGVWKPAPGAYHFAARTCQVEPAQMMLVAVHPWDIDGAGRAGLRTAWIDRTGLPYPAHFRPPDIRARSLSALADALA